MTLTELDKDFKKARRVDFNMNFPRISVYFDTSMEADVFYANMGEYFEDKMLAADFDIRDGFQLTIFCIETAEEIISSKLEFINTISYDRLLNHRFLNEPFLFGVGYIHHTAGASLNLSNFQFDVPLRIKRLTIIK